MKNTPDDDRLQRSRQARQVIAGSDVRPPSTPTYSSSYSLQDDSMFSPAQRTYLITIAVLLIVGLALFFIFSFGVASIIFFLLSLALFAGWVVF